MNFCPLHSFCMHKEECDGRLPFTLLLYTQGRVGIHQWPSSAH